MKKYKVALAQMNTGNNKKENIKIACKYVEEAAKQGASLICFPETMNIEGKNIGEGGMEEFIPGYTTDCLMEQAKKYEIWIYIGSIHEKTESGKCKNTSVLIDTQGKIRVTYSKIHMFDVTLPDGTVCAESEKIDAGEEIVTIDTELGILGMSICYDLRFPELFRIMAIEGAQVLFVPASFTKATGEAHWETLLRARAIENGCYVIASNQVGKKEQYEAYGNSMIVDPWGNILVNAKEETGVFCAEIDLEYTEEIRKKIPSLKNRREDIYRLLRL